MSVKFNALTAKYDLEHNMKSVVSIRKNLWYATEWIGLFDVGEQRHQGCQLVLWQLVQYAVRTSEGTSTSTILHHTVNVPTI
jgi:hypothetical protein